MNGLRTAIGRGLFAAGTAAVIILFIYLTFPVMYPFILAFLLAWFIKKPADYLHRKTGLPIGISSGTILLILIIIVSGVTALLTLQSISLIQRSASLLPAWLNQLSGAFNDILSYQVSPLIGKISEQFSALNPSQQSTIIAELEQAGNGLISEAGNILRALLNAIPAIILWIPNAASVLIIIVIAAFFICKDWDRVILFLNRKLPQKVTDRLYLFGLELGRALNGLLKAQLLLNTVTMAAVYPGLLILGVPHAVTISLFIGLADFIPYAGTGTIFVPWVLYLLLTGQTKLASGLTVLFLIIMIARQILEPRIYSRSVGLNPLLTLMGIYAGYKCFGLLGMALGPIILVVIQSIYKMRLFHDVWKYITQK
ncbi:sporulation integral membrane protein YtvI [Bacillus sp. FJAT-42376]|uniref:sporulation integral membrane protein YtvI n=1 Tax=Bacillus sp. FJAT-42376 TaxID=2014076 RepID=UPI000F50D7D0|nr:sporulation integral membrane protein YtvI [Bacillus sp. FJAT-42376]AZB43906.1 sporulation integral membrane protein YtvI [Bacillus sp. FJAT-42376]